jgi:hypothetical protein
LYAASGRLNPFQLELTHWLDFDGGLDRAFWLAILSHRLDRLSHLSADYQARTTPGMTQPDYFR